MAKKKKPVEKAEPLQIGGAAIGAAAGAAGTLGRTVAAGAHGLAASGGRGQLRRVFRCRLSLRSACRKTVRVGLGPAAPCRVDRTAHRTAR